MERGKCACKHAHIQLQASKDGVKSSGYSSAAFRILQSNAIIDSKYLAKALTEKSSADIETIYKYAPIVQWKNWGYFSMDTGKQMKDVLMGKKDLSDYTMWAAGKMDEMTWKRLWVASELEIQDKFSNLEVETDEYYKEVGKRFSEIIDRTQVVDSMTDKLESEIEKL